MEVDTEAGAGIEAGLVAFVPEVEEQALRASFELKTCFEMGGSAIEAWP